MGNPRTRSSTLVLLCAGSIVALIALWCAIGPAPDRADAPATRIANAARGDDPADARAEVLIASEAARPASRAPAPEPTIRGRLVDLSTGLGIPGWRIRLMAQDLRPESFVTALLAARQAAPRSLEFVVGSAIEPGAVRLELSTRISQFLQPQTEAPVVRIWAHDARVQVLDLTDLVAVQAPPEPAPAPAEELAAVGGLRLMTRTSLVLGDGRRPRLYEIEPSRFLAAPSWSAGPPRVLAESVTDQDGFFELPCTDVEGVWLEAPAADGLYVEPSRFELAESQRFCSEEITWKVEVHRGGIFRARAVDERTSEPVPGLEMRLSFQRGGRWTLHGDDEGRFESAEPFPEGKVDVLFLDGAERVPVAADASTLDFVPLADAADEPVFRVAIGPTWRFDVVGPESADLSDLRVRFHGLRPEAGDDDLGDWRPLGDGDQRSIRLARPVRRLGRGPALAEVTSRDGMLGGSIEISSTTGVSPIERVALAPRASLSGTILGPSGRPVEGASVFVRRADASRLTVLDRAVTDENGQYELKGLVPDDVTGIEVRHGALGARVIAVALEPGQATTLDVDL